MHFKGNTLANKSGSDLVGWEQLMGALTALALQIAKQVVINRTHWLPFNGSQAVPAFVEGNMEHSKVLQ